MEIPDLTLKNSNYHSEKYIKLHYLEFYNFICSKYSHIENFQEKLYCYANNCEPHRCPYCNHITRFEGFNSGYRKYCSSKCANNCPEVKEKIKNTNIEKYGVEHSLQCPEVRKKGDTTKLSRYGDINYNNRKKAVETSNNKYGVGNYNNRIKSMETCEKHYGVSIPTQCSIIRNKIKKTCIDKYNATTPLSSEYYKQKIKDTFINKYGVDNPSKCQSIKDKKRNTFFKKYGVYNFAQTDEYKKYVKDHHDEIQEKIYNTKNANNSFNKSTIEEQFKQYLEDNHINYIYQYRSDLYPFDCDFYFPDKDIYLEVNGIWCHGGHPYNPIKDKDKLNKWIERSKTSDYYKNAIETWTIRDPKKVRVAKENSINLKVFYGCKLEELLKFCKENNII